MSTTRITRFIRAPRSAVYAAITDGASVQRWMVPDGMTSEVHHFEAHEGGAFRVSLIYEDTGSEGKTTAHTDTYHGTFVALVPSERIVETVEFETDNPALQGEMTLTIVLRDVDGGTQLDAVHENVPSDVKPEDNDLGWRMSLGKLAELVERNP